jgi:hypothetical protein
MDTASWPDSPKGAEDLRVGRLFAGELVYRLEFPEGEMNIVRSQATARVVLASRDRRFLRVMGFALERIGCISACATDPTAVLDLVASHRATVVVVDGTESIAAASELTDALAALAPPARVLVVHDDALRISSRTFPLLAKWDDPELLAREVLRRHMEATAS